MEYSKKLLDLIDFLLKNYKYITKNNKYVKENHDLIWEETNFLPDDALLNQRFYCLKNNICEIPKCYCGKKLKWNKTAKVYPKKYCSQTCKGNSKDFQENWKKTMLKNHGVENPMQYPEIQNRIIQTNLKKLGVEYPIQSPKVREKMFKTMNERGTNIGYSKSSQRLFQEIYKNLSEELQEKTYFGEHNGEFKDYTTSNFYLYDFVISSLKICIEFNGEHIHPNPNMTEEKQNNWRQAWTGKIANEINVYDQQKLDILKKRGFKFW